MTRHLIFHDCYHASTEPLDGSSIHKNSVTLVRLQNYYQAEEVALEDPTSLLEYERIGKEILSQNGRWEPGSIPGENAYVVA